MSHAPRSIALVAAAAFAVACSSSTPSLPIEPAPEVVTRPAPDRLEPERADKLPAPSATAVPSATAAPTAKPAQGTVQNPGFTLPPEFSARAVVGAGDELFTIKGREVDKGQVARLKRSGEQLANKGPGGDGARIRIVHVGGKPVAVATGEMGAAAFYRGGKWDYRLAPAIEGEAAGAVAFDAGGVVYVAGVDHALYKRNGDRWSTHPYGAAAKLSVVEAFKAGGGPLYLIGAHGKVVSFSGGGFQDVAISGLAAGSITVPWVTSWVDHKRQTVWLAGSKTLASVDLKAKRATIHQSKLFFDLKALHGVSLTQGPLLMLGTFGRVALFDGSAWYEVDSAGADWVFLDRAKAHAYVASMSGMRVLQTKHPWLGTGKGSEITN